MALDQIPNTLEVELSSLANDILTNYENGNKSTARAMFRQIPEHRKAFVTLQMMTMQSRFYLADIDRLIRSVTE